MKNRSQEILKAVIKKHLFSLFKPCIFSLLSALFPGCLSAQTPTWDSLYVPDIYHSRVEIFNAVPASSKDIVLLGNSITFWGEWNELLKTKHIKNQGIPGDTSFGLLRRIDAAVKGNPSKIFILIGINDLGKNTPERIILENCRRIVQRIKAKSPKTKVYLQTILPTNDSFGKLKHLYHKESSIALINTELKALAVREGVGFIDLHSHFTDENGKLKTTYTWDGVHLTLAGYKKWAEVLSNAGYVKAKSK